MSAAVVSAIAAALIIDGLTDEGIPADVGIVLGSKVNPDGVLSERLQARLAAALALYNAGTVKKLIVSGAVGKEGHDEAAKMRDHLVAQGVPTEAIFVDSLGIDTRATAENAKRLMQEHGLVSAIAVTQYFHITRTKLALATAGIQVAGGAHAHFTEWRDLYSTARELAALIPYGLRYLFR